MSASAESRRASSASFATPRRGPFLRSIDWIGRRVSWLGLEAPLSAEAIVAAARREARADARGPGLSREALEVLVAAFENEAAMTPTGRMFIRLLLTRTLAQQLRIAHRLERMPEILDAPVRRPLIVVGPPRSGTTLLYKLLTLDPASRPLRMWESLNPAPIGRTFLLRRDLRLIRARTLVRGADRVLPGLRAVHPLSAAGPEECTWLMANTLTSYSFTLFGHVPGYSDWLARLEPEAWREAYALYRRQLQILHEPGDSRRWLLKSPVHMQALDALLDTLDDAMVVRTHRDPAEVVPSTCSLFGMLRGLASDRADPRAHGREAVEQLAALIGRANAAAARHPSRVLDVDYEALVGDHAGTVQRIYEHFSLEPPGGMLRTIRERQAGASFRSEHRYTLEQFGLTADEVRRRVPY